MRKELRNNSSSAVKFSTNSGKALHERFPCGEDHNSNSITLAVVDVWDTLGESRFVVTRWDLLLKSC